MGGEQERRRATTRADDVIRGILLDHAEIKEVFAETAAATGERKARAFERLVTKLAIHETAEEVVHLFVRSTPDGDAIVSRRLEEQAETKGALAELEQMRVGDPRFDHKREDLRRNVEAHAEREEQDEHARLEQAVSQERLARLATVFRLAERSAPTHPQPQGPESASGNLIVSPVAAMIARTRDAIRKALKASELHGTSSAWAQTCLNRPLWFAGADVATMAKTSSAHRPVSGAADLTAPPDASPGYDRPLPRSVLPKSGVTALLPAVAKPSTTPACRGGSLGRPPLQQRRNGPSRRVHRSQPG